MVYTSTQALQNSLPNRAPSARPRSLSLSEYQPITFDREATASAYRAQLHQPVSSSTSSTTRYTSEGSTSTQSHETETAPSSLSHKLRPGDNPHTGTRGASSPIDITTNGGGGPFQNAENFAGVGAGHSLTPPQSPLHHQAAELHRSSLTLSGSAEELYTDTAPELPRRPSVIPESTYPATGRQRSGSDLRRNPAPSWLSHQDQEQSSSAVSVRTNMGTVGVSKGRERQEVGGDGWDSDPGYPRYVGGRSGGRRELPAVPTNVPRPEPPGWEPDYKSHIPTQLTQSSVEHAYAQLSAPPPGLPPRRTQPRQNGSSSSVMPQMSQMNSFNSQPSSGHGLAETPSLQPIHSMDEAGPSGFGSGYERPSGPPPGAPSFPPDPDHPAFRPPKPRRPAEESVTLRAEGRTPIWSTHYLDPCLRNPLINIPQQVSNMTNMALSNLSAKEGKNGTGQANMEGMARMAKGWFVPPDGKFMADKGAVELGIGVIDCGGREGEEGWGREKGRRKARVEVSTRSGGIKLDLLEIDENRHVDVKVDTKSGDILVLLPREFFGSINITTSGSDPHFCTSLSSAIAPLNHPHDCFFTTYIAPPSLTSAPSAYPAYPNSNSSAGIRRQRWVPDFMRNQEDHPVLSQAGESSKVTITSQGKGKVVLGYRETGDELEVKALGVMVGMEGQERKRRWWK